MIATIQEVFLLDNLSDRNKKLVERHGGVNRHLPGNRVGLHHLDHLVDSQPKQQQFSQWTDIRFLNNCSLNQALIFRAYEIAVHQKVSPSKIILNLIFLDGCRRSVCHKFRESQDSHDGGL